MHKKLTISLDEEIYNGLHKVIGRHKISRFIESLLRPHILKEDLVSAYKEMAKDEVREKEALEWVEATSKDVSDETR